MDSIKQLYNRYRRFQIEREWGLRLRNQIHRFASTVDPYIRVLIPNFRSAHYCYIITWTFLGSVLFFPVRNVPYIDALFFTGGASTQAGLNTIDTNTLALYQQILIYIIATLTTPIFIHGSLLFIRLYWFERHFDNIKEKSKLDFKMRRQATLASRTHSMDATRLNTVNNQNLGFRPTSEHVSKKDKSSGYRDEVINIENTSPQSSSSIPKSPSPHTVAYDGVEHISEPSDTDEDRDDAGNPNGRRGESIPLGSLEPAENDHHEALDTNEQVTFGNLPQPSKQRRKIDPSDMYRSIAIMQDKHNKNNTSNKQNNDSGSSNSANNANNNDEDDVLIIKPPNVIENSDSRNPIYTKKKRSTFHKKGHRGSSGAPWKHKKSQWSNRLRKTFSNSGQNTVTSPKNKRSFSGGSEEVDEDIDDEMDDVSIDSENEVTDDREDADGDADVEDDEEAVIDDEDDHDQHSPERHVQHLQLPVHNRKDFKRPENGRKHSFVRSPTFERMINMRKNRRKGKLRRIKTPSVSLFSGSGTAVDVTDGEDNGYDTNQSYDTEDEEESYDSEDGQPLSRVMSTNYLSWVPTVGRNSTFIHMTEEQKEELGGVEYRAVKLLIKILLAYYIGFHILAFTLLLPWVLMRQAYIEKIRAQGISPTWWAFFTAQTAFNDLGITLTADSMMTFSKSVFVMIVTAFFVVIGNTGFPVFLRFLIWILFKIAPPLSSYKESLGFLLDHPRRCFTLLFPSVPTWWLFIILVVLNGVDLVLFILLDLNNDYLTEIPVGFRIVDGLFQAFSTRTAGFAVVDLSKLHPAVQVSYMIMMYISVLPLAISIRRTNVYEEQSLGVYLKDDNENDDLEKTPQTFIGAHLRNQLSFDLWFIFLGLFIICIAEGPKLNKGDIRFTVFSILFEIISAYGTVGLSLGYPTVNASLSSQFTVISKLVIIAMMIRGRHRGLPYALDRAIMLPDADMKRRDHLQEHHAIRRNNTMERANTISASTFDNLGENHILRRVMTLEGNLFRRRRSSVGSRSGDIGPTVSENPSYIVTTASREIQEVEDSRHNA
ncbi:low affinity potassium transporter [Scheffersomyces xylosifermentans]|uniref:low affinity potassium transporter n=1 Tax=Scheffersomyces xylosifermentans TaxID=1304137 RepID=UPI00315CDEA5